MAILLKNGALFFHIPRTGGNWITLALQELGLYGRKVDDKHADLEHFYAQNLLNTGPFKFCFVRHPLSWYESWFKYAIQKEYPTFPPGHPNAPLNGLVETDFSRFITRVIEEIPGYLSRMYQGFTGAMAFVGHQERLEVDFVKALKLAGLEVDGDRVKSLGRFGVSPSRVIKWDERLRGELLRCEQAAMVEYGYETP